MLLCFVAAVALAGHQASDALWRRTLSGLERITSSAVMATAIALAITWALALGGHLTYFALGIASLITLVIGAALFLVRPRPVDVVVDSERRPDVVRAAVICVFVTLGAWIAFLLWKGYVTPVLSHDALVYHLPRAAMFFRTGRFQDFHFPDPRIDGLPANYELLLADLLLLTPGDRIVEWLGTTYFVLLLIATAALVRRWWGGGAHVYAAVLLLCTAPVVILQGAAVKNDAMLTWLSVAAMLFAGRWLTTRELPAAIVVTIALFAAAGTKPQAFLVAFFIAPLFVWAAIVAWRERRLRMSGIAALLLAGIVSAALLGGYYYLHAFERQRAASHAKVRLSDVNNALGTGGYGEWAYLWQVPAMTWLAPFSDNDMDVLVPWSGQRWWWPRWDVHDSNYGSAISILILFAPFVIWRYRKAPDRAAAIERCAIASAALLAAITALPRRTVIFGNVSGYPRYLMFICPVIVAFIAPPLFDAIAGLVRREKRDAAQAALIAFCGVLFIATAIGAAYNDRYTPLGKVLFAAEHPGRSGGLYLLRSGAIVDSMATPTASIDMYASADSWVYPAMGPTLQRDLHFINGVAEIRPRAQWVIVDQAFYVVWGDTSFRDISDYSRFLGHGRPRAIDEQFIDTVGRDPRFEHVFVSRDQAQAIFHRLGTPIVRRN